MREVVIDKTGVEDNGRQSRKIQGPGWKWNCFVV